jgi:hypothetical protein
MMSISPFEGHSPLTPKVHHAGHMPAPTGMRARISKRPYCQLCRFQVVMLVEVYSAYWRLVFQSELPAW